MNNNIQHNTGLVLLEFLFITFCVIYFLVPGVEKSFGFTRFMVIEAIYSFIILFSSPKNVRNGIFFFWGLALFIGLFYGLFKVPFGITTGNAQLRNFINYYYFYSNMFFPLLLLYRVTIKASKKQVGILLLIGFVSTLLWSVFILRAIAINPLAARSFGHGQGGIEDENWIAPFYFVYGMTFMTLLFIFFTRYGRPWSLKAFFIIFMFYWLIFLIRAQFTIAIIAIFIVFVFMGYYLSDSKRKRRASFTTGIIILVLTPLLLDVLIPHLPDVLASRFSEIMDLNATREFEEGTDAKGRWNVYLGALQDFLSSPIWGVRQSSGNGHGSALMILGDLGLLGFMPLCLGLKRMRNVIMRIMGKIGFAYRPFFLLFLIHLFTNPIHASLVSDIMIGFGVPLFILKYQDNLKISQIC